MKLGDQKWRLNNLYFIKDKQGNKIKFKLNWAQEALLNDSHNKQIVLKARQLGITTFYCIYALDAILFNDYMQAGIIAHTLKDVQSIFYDKLKFTFDNLPPPIKALFKKNSDSANELSFSHGSLIRVGTSLRSSTLNILHISEFGKICARYQEKAREVVTGALQTIAPGQKCFIESTAEGREGYFFDLCNKSMRKTEGLNELDYSFHFFPWYKQKEYSLSHQVDLDKNSIEYFGKLQTDRGIKLTQEQQWWYQQQKNLLQDDMTREYPSYPEEAFESSQIGNWYAEQMKELWGSGRVTKVAYDRSIPVHTAWDLGQNDAMAIFFFQIDKLGQIRVIDYFERSDFPISDIVSLLKDKNYSYGTHIWPHDAKARDKGGITFEMQMADYNITGLVLKPHKILDGINLVRSKLSTAYFDQEKCSQGLIALANYKKKWSTAIGGYTSEEVHDKYSHGAAAFRYLCSGLDLISNETKLEETYSTINSYLNY